MSENGESEVEEDPYEEIVGLNLNHSTPMASITSSPLPRDKNESGMTHFNGPIVKRSESEVVSTSTGLVASVTWPDLRYPCSLAGKNSSARLLSIWTEIGYARHWRPTWCSKICRYRVVCSSKVRTQGTKLYESQLVFRRIVFTVCILKSKKLIKYGYDNNYIFCLSISHL